jgi:hypothetical protein
VSAPVTEHGTEPVPGLPEPLPEEERILWQGGPRWQSLAVSAFHVRKVAVYFGLLLAWRFGAGIADGLGVAGAAAASTGLLTAAVLAVVLLTALAWGYARTTVYTITSRRVVMRFGLALPMTVNLPFKLVESAAVRMRRDGSGDLPLAMAPESRLSWLVMWPNTRPWRFGGVQPMLRAVADAERVAKTLGGALASYAGVAPKALEPKPRRDTSAPPLATAAR